MGSFTCLYEFIHALCLSKSTLGLGNGRNNLSAFVAYDWLSLLHVPRKTFLYLICKCNYFLASGNFCRLLITFANSLDPDQDRQNLGPGLIQPVRHGGTVSSPNYTFFLCKLEQALNQYFVHILSLLTDNHSSGMIRRKGGMPVEISS